MRQRFGNAAYSPAELTIAATKYFTSDRVFPGRAGLEVSQMLEAIRFAGHDPLHLDLREIESNPNRAREVINRAGPYLESGLPVILALQHKRRGHAVVAIGRNAEAVPAVEAVDPTLRGTEDWISGLIVQNDALGPYQVLQDLLGPANPELRYELWHADSLIVPLPDAVFTTAAEARQLAQKALQKASILFTADESRDPGFLEGPTVEMALRTYLCRRHTFRRWAKNAPELSHVVRGAFRTAELPPLIWVVELHIAEMYDPIGRSPSRCGEVILDASADTLHGDGLIAIRLSGRMFPELGIENSLLLVEGESLKFVTTEMGDLGQALWEPWRDSEDV